MAGEAIDDEHFRLGGSFIGGKAVIEIQTVIDWLRWQELGEHADEWERLKEAVEKR